MHPLFLLAFATFVVIIAFLVWNLLSAKRHRFSRDVSGPGGSNDPLSGKNANVRDPDELRAALDGKR
jgi:hypothetical protein